MPTGDSEGVEEVLHRGSLDLSLEGQECLS